MDGIRWTKLAAVGLLTAAVGCSGTKSQQTTSGLNAQLPGQGESRWARVFGPPKPPGPMPPPVEVATDAPKGKKKDISPATQVTFAKVQVDSAFMEGQQQSDSLLDSARGRFQKVLAADPKNAEALKGLAELYTRTRDREKALQAYQTLVQFYPKDHAAAYAMALACASFDEWAAATGAVEYALSIDPENRRYRKTYGKCLAWSGQADRALEELAKVLPEAEARYSLARVLTESGNKELGRQQLQLAVQVDPNFGPAREALAQFDAPGGQPQNPVRQVGYEAAGGN